MLLFVEIQLVLVEWHNPLKSLIKIVQTLSKPFHFEAILSNWDFPLFFYTAENPLHTMKLKICLKKLPLVLLNTTSIPVH